MIKALYVVVVVVVVKRWKQVDITRYWIGLITAPNCRRLSRQDGPARCYETGVGNSIDNPRKKRMDRSLISRLDQTVGSRFLGKSKPDGIANTLASSLAALADCFFDKYLGLSQGLPQAPSSCASLYSKKIWSKSGANPFVSRPL